MPVLSKNFESQKYTVTYLVDEKFDQFRLDNFLKYYIPSFSREAIKRKIKTGDIQIMDRPGHPRSSSKVHYGENVRMTIHRTSHEDEYWQGKKLDLETIPTVLFEDDHLIAIAKPPYMATHPTGKHLFNCATVYFESRDQKTIHSIHRLDRETSGVLLLGKSPKSAAICTEAFERGKVKKCYFFIAKSKPKDSGTNSFEAHERLGTQELGLKRVYINAYPKSSQQGKHAYTQFEVLYREAGYVLGLAFPQTGRQHQIRVHAATHGLPLVGDKLYLGSYEMFQRFKDGLAGPEDHQLMELPRHALHACALKLPYQNQSKLFICPLPHDLQTWIQQRTNIPLDELEKKISQKIKSIGL